VASFRPLIFSDGDIAATQVSSRELSIAVIKAPSSSVTFVINQGDTAMAEKGSKDKGNREQKSKAVLSLKEKRKQKQEKKSKTS